MFCIARALWMPRGSAGSTPPSATTSQVQPPGPALIAAISSAVVGRATARGAGSSAARTTGRTGSGRGGILRRPIGRIDETHT